MRRGVLAAGAAAAVFAVAAPAAAAATGAVSANWAGYAVAGRATRFRSVTSSWTQPAVRCQPGRAAYSVFWIGLGGVIGTSQSLEQAGTEADCGASGRAYYAAWYELLPAAPVYVRLHVRPGDTVTASVAVSGRRVRVRLTDRERRTDIARTVRMSAPPDVSSAEWIAEAPAACIASGCSPLPLANFGSVRFRRASAIANAGRPRVISYRGWSLFVISLQAAAASAGAPAAVPSSLTGGGTSFVVSVAGTVASAAGAHATHRYPASPR